MPTTILCFACAESAGHLHGLVSSSLLSTPYQQRKYEKHTSGSSSLRINSLFHDSSIANYKSYFVSASISGTLEIQGSGAKNLIVFAGKSEGALYSSGTYQLEQESVKVVLYDDPGKAHAFATSSAMPQHQVCASCGGPAPH